MICLICRGDDIRTEQVKEELRIANDVVQVPVEALVCQTCGEHYYNRRAIQFLEQTEQRLKDGAARLRQVGKVMLLE